MARPKKKRILGCPPRFACFKPAGVRRINLQQLNLSLDEFEAIKLADYDDLDQQEAANEMGVSRPTFTRLVDSAHKKMAEFLIDGKELIIEGGNINFRNNFIECLNCGHKFKIKIDKNIEECPSCHSKNLLDYAGCYGYGRGCKKNNV